MAELPPDTEMINSHKHKHNKKRKFHQDKYENDVKKKKNSSLTEKLPKNKKSKKIPLQQNEITSSTDIKVCDLFSVR